jgi:hypothetical protein
MVARAVGRYLEVMQTQGTGTEGGEAPLLPDNEVIAEWSLGEGTRWKNALGAGLLGAFALTLAHESARALTRKGPRMDRVGQRGLAKLVRRAGRRPPRGKALYGAALAGDLVSNALVYGLAFTGTVKRTWGRGLLAGLAMGAGAVLLPPALGISNEPKRWSWRAKAMACAAYLLGGAVTAYSFNALERSEARDVIPH